ncbi:F-actin-capping protein subunit alpha protein [Dioscorea alata]|uniref:F-actin-capping protein subunit alpha protein n=1 Tax=Dioscorea alata TaxID=55571 RepID=A0ACB7V0E8_DIOAL|nr:F-actin-capping protein subunit alpha protein [Dioscorea alata]
MADLVSFSFHFRVLFFSSPPTSMADGADEHEEAELHEEQKKEIAKWFLAHAPAGEIQYVAKDVKSLLGDDRVYKMAASEALPVYNKTHLVALEMPDRSGNLSPCFVFFVA